MESMETTLREPDAIGRRLVQALAARGWTQKQLAREAGVPTGTISGACNGRRRGEDLKLGASLRICMALGISLEWLAGRWIDDAPWVLIGPGGSEQGAGTLLPQRGETLLGSEPHDARDDARRAGGSEA
jgi:transcriptional regulator with XRE-family HTH domain